MRFFKQDKAFSFIELVVVIVIFGIIALVASSKFGPYDAMKIDAAARKIASDITYAQQLAMTNAYSSSVGIVIDFNPADESPIMPTGTNINSYRIFRGYSNLFVNDPFSKENFVVDFNAGTYQGVTIDRAEFRGSDEVIYNNLGFTRYRGVAEARQYNSFLMMYITKGFSVTDKEGEITISYHGKTRTIVVTMDTGRVSIYRGQ